MAKPTNLPRGLIWENERELYRIQFFSRHTQPGRRYRERLPKSTTLRQAETYLNKLREDDRLGLLVWPSDRRLESEPPEILVFSDFVISVYLPYCEARNQPSTIARKKAEFKRIAPWFWDVPLEQVDAALVAQFATERKAEGLRDRTVNIGIKQVRHVLSVAHRLGYLPHAPPYFESLPEKDKRSVRWLTHEEAEAILQYTYDKSPSWFAVVLFFLHTGARYSEARNLLWEHIDLERGLVSFHNTKNGRSRTVPLLPEVIEAIDKLPRESEYVFMYEAQVAQSRTRDGEGTFWRRIPPGGEVGTRGNNTRQYPWDPPGLFVYPHMFRHTFATWRLRAGVSIAIVSRWLGHSSIQLTVDTYGHIAPEEHLEEIGRGFRPQINSSKSSNP